VPLGWAWSVRWLGMGTYVRSLPKTRIHRALDEILSFRSTVFGNGKSDGLDNQGLYDALRIKAVIIELQDRGPRYPGWTDPPPCFLYYVSKNYLAPKIPKG
jgi:hypothetical protein